MFLSTGRQSGLVRDPAVGLETSYRAGTKGRINPRVNRSAGEREGESAQLGRSQIRTTALGFMVIAVGTITDGEGN